MSDYTYENVFKFPGGFYSILQVRYAVKTVKDGIILPQCQNIVLYITAGIRTNIKILNMIVLSYNSSINKKQILSNLHFTCNIAIEFVCFCYIKQNQSRIKYHMSPSNKK